MVVPSGSLVEFLAARLLLDRLALAEIAREELGFNGPLSGLRAALRDRSGRPTSPTSEQRAFLVFQLAQVLGWPPETLRGLAGRAGEQNDTVADTAHFPELLRDVELLERRYLVGNDTHHDRVRVTLLKDVYPKVPDIGFGTREVHLVARLEFLDLILAHELVADRLDLLRTEHLVVERLDNAVHLDLDWCARREKQVRRLSFRHQPEKRCHVHGLPSAL